MQETGAPLTSIVDKKNTIEVYGASVTYIAQNIFLCVWKSTEIYTGLKKQNFHLEMNYPS